MNNPKMGITAIIKGKKYDLVYKDTNKVKFDKMMHSFSVKGFDVEAINPANKGFWYLYARER
jgi:hypothetical protein